MALQLHRRSGGVQLSNKRPGLFGLFALCVDHVLRGTRGEGLVGQLGLDALEVLLRLFALGGDALQLLGSSAMGIYTVASWVATVTMPVRSAGAAVSTVSSLA